MRDWRLQAAIGGLAGALAACADDADRTHDLRVAIFIEAGPVLESGCGEFHLPDPP